MLSMDDRAGDELSALRRRAYGPGADIDGDAAALQRLRELENQEWARESETTAAADAAESAVQTGEISLAEDRDIMPAAAARTPPRIGRALLIGWVASVVLVAVVVGGLVFSLASLRPVAPATGVRQVASLDQPELMPVNYLPWAKTGDRGTSYRFEGLEIVVGSGVSVGFEGRCLFVTTVAPDANGSRSGRPACSSGPFHPSVSILVDQSSPPELRARFADGSALEFVWDGTAVSVFAADAPASLDAPA